MTDPHATTRATSPLAGLRVVVTRSEDRADGLVERLRALGAEPIIYPTIAFAPPEDCGPLDAALQRLSSGGYDWLILTSVTAVQVVAQRLPPVARHASAAAFAVAAVGPTTAAACVELLGMTPAVMPEQFIGEALAEALGDRRGQRVLLANADIARPALEEQLRAAGALVERVIAYHTVPASGGDVDMPALLAAGAVDVITFTSGSTARYFVQRIGPAALEAARRTVIACIGPATAAVARQSGLPPALVAEVFTEEGLVAALVRELSHAQSSGAV